MNILHEFLSCKILIREYYQGRRERGRSPVENFFRTHFKGGPTKNLYTKSESLTVSYRAIWAWFERDNLYNQQLNDSTDKDRNVCNIVGPRVPFRTSGLLYRLPLPLVGTEY
jgi:hypothetical protein